MKAEERHELKENNLQSWLQYGLPMWLKQNGSYLILAAALAVLGYQLWSRYQANQLADAERAMGEVLSAEALPADQRPSKDIAVIDEHDSKPIQSFAMRDLGNAYLETVAAGVSQDVTPTTTVPAANASLPKSVTTADKEDTLNRAQAEFERILKQSPDLPLTAGAAAVNLAIVAEDRGDWASAKKQYQAIVDKSSRFAGTPFAEIAAQRLKNLETWKNAPKLAEFPVVIPAPAATLLEKPSAIAPLPSGEFFPPAPEPARPATSPGPTSAPSTVPAAPSPLAPPAPTTHPSTAPIAPPK
jgi:predicted negative regulator of RcsB-dependent stress response